jgi:hypothetical protein
MILIVYDDGDLNVSSFEESVTQNPRIGVIQKLLVHPDLLINPDGHLDQEKLNEETQDLCGRINGSSMTKTTRYEQLYLPVIFIGIGVGAIVTMNYLVENMNVVPMGVMLISNTFSSPIRKRFSFKSWYKRLENRKDEESKNFKDLLQKFNSHCRSERIRVSCMAPQALEGEESNLNAASFHRPS